MAEAGLRCFRRGLKEPKRRQDHDDAEDEKIAAATRRIHLIGTMADR